VPSVADPSQLAKLRARLQARQVAAQAQSPPAPQQQANGGAALLQALMNRMPDERGATRFTNDFGTEEIRGPSSTAWPAYFQQLQATLGVDEGQAKSENLLAEAAKSGFAVRPEVMAAKIFAGVASSNQQPLAVAQRVAQQVREMLGAPQQTLAGEGENQPDRRALARARRS